MSIFIILYKPVAKLVKIFDMTKCFVHFLIILFQSFMWRGRLFQRYQGI